MAELAKQVEAGQAEDTPKQLDTPGRRALYNLLRQGTTADGGRHVAQAVDRFDVSGNGGADTDDALAMALRIDETVKRTRSDAWRGVPPKENVIKAALYAYLHNPAEVERIFLIIRQQKEY